MNETLTFFYSSRKCYYPPEAYNQSKLAQVLFTRYLQKVLDKDSTNNVQIYAVHPGVVDTDLFCHSSTTYIPWFKKLFFKVSSIFSWRTFFIYSFDPLFRLRKKDHEPLSMPQYRLDWRVKEDRTSAIVHSSKSVRWPKI